MNKPKVILTDIEGTTSSITFVKEVLFPYARAAIPTYLESHASEEHVQNIINDVIAEVPESQGMSDADTRKSVALILQTWIDEDQKKTPLKSLQGYIWKQGYEQGDYTAHMYPDAVEMLQNWAQTFPIYVYSSGSIKAQDLFFRFSDAGNIKSLFKGFFDTTSGSKKETQSYWNIAKKIGEKPEDILFLSDILDEILAAKTAGYQVCWLQREFNEESGKINSDSIAKDFFEVNKKMNS